VEVIVEGVLDILSSPSFLAAAIRIATPLMFGVLGALVCERAGVLNLGIEGIFTAGAMAGWMSVYFGADLWTGVAIAALTGAVFGLILALLTVPLGLSQHVTGIGVTLLATSASYFIYRMVLPNVASPPRITPFQPLQIPGLSDLPFIGPVLSQQTALTFLALCLFGVVAYGLYRTPLGLALRAAGENPAAVEAQGLDVHRLRIGAVVVGSALMALGGAFLTMSAFNAFFFEMTGGRGWICIALTVFASWRPGKALLGALLFGAFDAFQLRLQTQIGGAVPSQIFLMLPYLLSIMALCLVARRADYPAALMIPYVKGQR
jgi:general nucleoside transport system permease protein